MAVTQKCTKLKGSQGQNKAAAIKGMPIYQWSVAGFAEAKLLHLLHSLHLYFFVSTSPFVCCHCFSREKLLGCEVGRKWCHWERHAGRPLHFSFPEGWGHSPTSPHHNVVTLMLLPTHWATREQFSPPVRLTDLNIDTTQTQNWKPLSAELEETKGFCPRIRIETYFVIGIVN